MNNQNIKESTIEEDSTVEEEFDIEQSHELSLEFIRYSILPLLENFESDPPSEDYCPGTLTYNLFLYAINEMIKGGWNKEELVSELSNFYDHMPENDDEEVQAAIDISDFPDPENPTIN